MISALDGNQVEAVAEYYVGREESGGGWRTEREREVTEVKMRARRRGRGGEEGAEQGRRAADTFLIKTVSRRN